MIFLELSLFHLRTVQVKKKMEAKFFIIHIKILFLIKTTFE